MEEDPFKAFIGKQEYLDNFFQILEIHKKSCLRQNLLEDAEMTQKNILVLRTHAANIEKESLQQKFNKDFYELELWNKEQVDQINKYWEGIALDYEKKFKEDEEQLLQEQTAKMEQLKTFQLEKQNQCTISIQLKLIESSESGSRRNPEVAKEKTKLKDLKQRQREERKKLSGSHKKQLEITRMKAGKKRNEIAKKWKSELEIQEKKFLKHKKELLNKLNVGKKNQDLRLKAKKRAMVAK